jgi:hypothetical protein
MVWKGSTFVMINLLEFDLCTKLWNCVLLMRSSPHIPAAALSLLHVAQCMLWCACMCWHVRFSARIQSLFAWMLSFTTVSGNPWLLSSMSTTTGVCVNCYAFLLFIIFLNVENISVLWALTFQGLMNKILIWECFHQPISNRNYAGRRRKRRRSRILTPTYNCFETVIRRNFFHPCKGLSVVQCIDNAHVVYIMVFRKYKLCA